MTYIYIWTLHKWDSVLTSTLTRCNEGDGFNHEYSMKKHFHIYIQVFTVKSDIDQKKIHLVTFGAGLSPIKYSY